MTLASTSVGGAKGAIFEDQQIAAFASSYGASV